ncbi:hypothetical protein SCP_0704370 [Sparassis crispa]|uniref:Uncharacterized protein n=1 Tax=Sparassis crispa TaxID=139825 RepID=A0A401GSV0_9APHY|nr:hypothetical protein SCP_0704370 [Sparassis crispa]GBE85250.1 hypothetical protein SCP_0704370 [Sparassis crispa]
MASVEFGRICRRWRSMTRVQRAYRPPFVPFSPRRILQARNFHQTPLALRKKQKGSKADSGDLFGSDDSGESLFGLDDSFGKDAGTPEGAGGSSSQKLSPEARLTRFNDTRKFVSDRIGRKPAVKVPQVRNATWQHLFGLATTKEQMEGIVEMFPLWRDSKRKFNPQNVELFVRRCEELKCPTLALQVFSDHPKYGFDLSSLTAARRLLHSLHVEHPLQYTITLSALFRVYKLPVVSSDLLSCAMLTSACFKHGTHQSLAIASEMVPHLMTLLEKVEPETMQLPRESMERAKESGKEKAWLAWTLNKIEKALQTKGQDHAWLSQWRQASGHAQLSS